MNTLRCVFCHDDLGRDRATCEGCRATYHPECLSGLPRCSTLGCGTVRVSPVPRSGVWQGPLLLAGMAALGLSAISPAGGLLVILSASGVMAFVLLMMNAGSSYARPVVPPVKEPTPVTTGSRCVLCPRDATDGSTCADHAALVADRLGPTLGDPRIRPGQTRGPGLIDAGERLR